jgi:hypothetical protein
MLNCLRPEEGGLFMPAGSGRSIHGHQGYQGALYGWHFSPDPYAL